MRKAVFLDVDGTYMVGNQVPPSAADAVRAARANGHEVFLCTGRSLSEIYAHITEAGFDGVISAGGAVVDLEGRRIESHAYPRELLDRALAWLDAHGIDHILETDEAMLGSAGTRAHLARIAHPDLPQPDLDALVATDTDFLKPIVTLAGQNLDGVVHKILLLGSDVPLDAVRAEFGAELDVIGDTIPPFGPNMGELALPGVHKATAIERLLAETGVARADTIAFGDGTNDREMLDYVAIGVAMGDSPAVVLEAADLVVPAASEGGLAIGFRQLGLI